MKKLVEGIMNSLCTSIYCVVSLLVAIVIAGCGSEESAHNHAPGEIERLSNATIYHLTNGVFIHEAFEGADHYYLSDDIVESYERGNFGSIESKGKRVTVTIEYAGGELVVFDDEYGVAKFMQRPEADPNQDAEVQFDLPVVEVDRELGEVESELWLSPFPGRDAGKVDQYERLFQEGDNNDE